MGGIHLYRISVVAVTVPLSVRTGPSCCRMNSDCTGPNRRRTHVCCCSSCIVNQVFLPPPGSCCPKGGSETPRPAEVMGPSRHPRLLQACLKAAAAPLPLVPPPGWVPCEKSQRGDPSSWPRSLSASGPLSIAVPDRSSPSATLGSACLRSPGWAECGQRLRGVSERVPGQRLASFSLCIRPPAGRPPKPLPGRRGGGGGLPGLEVTCAPLHPQPRLRARLAPWVEAVSTASPSTSGAWFPAI